MRTADPSRSCPAEPVAAERPRSLRRRGPLAAAVLALGLSFGAGCAPEPPPAPPRSILLITIDTLRADHLGTYGYFRDTSPALDRLAGESLVFDHAIAPMAVTLPSHLSLLTATYPLEHGVLANVRHGGSPFTVNPRLATLAQFAKDRGMATAAFVSASPLKRKTGIEVGFDHYDQPRGHQRRAAETLEAAGEWLAANGAAGPYLAWIHLFDPHGRYDPPPPYDERYRTDPELEAFLAARGATLDWPAAGEIETTSEAINRYDGEIRYTDDRIAELRERLERLGLWSELVVIVAGDHGEGLGQHGEPYHGHVWGEQLRVPLLARIPGVAPRRVPTPISLADALPTILARFDRDGWKPLLDQATGGDLLAVPGRAPAVLSERTGRERRDLEGPVWSLTGERWKLVHRPVEGDLLFDLANDPHELVDVAAEHPETARELRDELIERLRFLASRAEELGTAELGGDGEESFDAERLEELRALGYLD